MTTLLNLTIGIADEIGLQRPVSVVSNTDDDVRMLLQMGQREGRALARFDWTLLQRLHTFTTTADTAEYALPSDYSRLIRETEWDRTNMTPMKGPVNPVEWQTIKSGGLGSGIVNRRFRIYRASSGNTRKIYIDPTPSTTGDTLAFEYISNGWCASSGGTVQSAWAADTDTLLLDDDLYSLGVNIRYRRAKGLDFASEADEYIQLFGALYGQDRPAPVLNLSNQERVRLLDNMNVPETGITG